MGPRLTSVSLDCWLQQGSAASSSHILACPDSSSGITLSTPLIQGEYLSAVLNPLQDYGKVWPIFRLVLPTLGHDAVAGRAEQETLMNSRSCGM